MIILILLSIGLIFFYSILIWRISYSWLQHKDLDPNRKLLGNITFSLLIPARNEALNIKNLLDSLSKLDYPSADYEIIVIDDHSTDDTLDIIEKYSNVKTIRLATGKGKKAALAKGIDIARFDNIITLDADVIVKSSFLKTYNTKWQESSDYQLITGGVIFNQGNNWVEDFQQLDVMSLMASTCYGIDTGDFFLANGANMSFKKSAYFAVGGYETNNSFASGDDVFLIGAIASKYGQKAVAFLQSREATVQTKPLEDLSSLLKQRYRWASKTKAYAQSKLIILQGLVTFIHFWIGALFILSIWQLKFLFLAISMLIIKALFDHHFLKMMFGFYQSQFSSKAFLTSFFFYFYYIFYLSWVALLPKKYTWKGRTVQ
jgi:poly-beta-1,6-N-acetyl-D-glucosamine synthase